MSEPRVKPRARRATWVQLLTLLRTGAWGTLRLGMTRQDAVLRLGQPTSWAMSDHEARLRGQGVPVAGWALSEILRFGAVEFHFAASPASRCWLVWCDDLDALDHPGVLRVRPMGLVEGAPLADVVARLAEAGLAGVVVPFPSHQDQVRLVLPSGAQLGFSSDPEFFDGPAQPGQRLYSVGVEAAAAPR
jgi:hypothetical protein